MKKFTLNLGQLKRKHGINIHQFLPEAGYTFRKTRRDFIKEMGGGRFHAIPKSSRTAEIHYDVYAGHKHVTFWMPETLGSEQAELNRLIAHLKKLSTASKVPLV